jgi:DnaK suppressor protein
LDSSGELSTYDNHPGDLGTETFERGRDQAVDETIEEQLAQINQALDLIEAGSYGLCKICGSEMPFERLQALPYVTTCIEHAEQSLQNDVPDSRPVEEQVMTRPPTERDVKDSAQISTDKADKDGQA